MVFPKMRLNICFFALVVIAPRFASIAGTGGRGGADLCLFSIIVAVPMVVMGASIIKSIMIRKQYYYDLSQVSNDFKYGRCYNCL